MEDITAIYEEILQNLERIITKMESMHTPSLSFGTGIPMHTKEIHTIQAIGRHSGINITRLAEQTGVTKGAVSQTINKLVRKGLVRKTHAPGNDKEVIPELTDLGWVGFQNHEKFHMDTLVIAREYYGDQLKSNLERINSAVADIYKMMKEYENKRSKEQYIF
jgi:DNA-binding MarR family transcriptional regulator